MTGGFFARFASAAFTRGEPLATITVTKAEGSTPRGCGAAMLVTADKSIGTIGGGRLEWNAIAAARQMLAQGGDAMRTVIALGPEIGQCCGGRVTLQIARVTNGEMAAGMDAAVISDAARNRVLIFGAGHVGLALARALAPLPMQVRLIDSRPEAFADARIDGVECVGTAQLTAEVQAAPAGSAFVVVTHSHALDALITATALERGDFCYLGLIGSATKRRAFENAFRVTGIADKQLQRITCPIGGRHVRDKRPAVIAALTAAEIISAQAAARAQASAADLEAA